MDKNLYALSVLFIRGDQSLFFMLLTIYHSYQYVIIALPGHTVNCN